MKKTDLSDTTFMIPVRIDSLVRLENVLIVTEFLLEYFRCRIVLLESCTSPVSVLQKLLGKEITYLFVHDMDPVFYKTKFVNRIAREVITEYLAIWDADIIAIPSQIAGAVEQLRAGRFDVAFPFNGSCYDTSDIIQACFYKYRKLSVLTEHTGKMHLMYGTDGAGGAVFAKTDKFRAAGGDNEAFYGWGPEDYERFERFFKLGYRIYREPGPLFHLTHPRGTNSGYRSKQYGINSNIVLKQTRASTAEELRDLLK